LATSPTPLFGIADTSKDAIRKAELRDWGRPPPPQVHLTRCPPPGNEEQPLPQLWNVLFDRLLLKKHAILSQPGNVFATVSDFESITISIT
jgi:hypothetical protein